jgi:hypothetical protein
VIVHVDELLRPLSTRMPRELVSEEALATVSEVAHLLPRMSGGISLECRLEEGASQVDFMACGMLSDGSAQALADMLASAGERLRGPLWDGVRAFSREWLDARSLLARVPFLWLEYDLPRPLGGVPQPFAFLCVEPEFLKPPGRALEHRKAVDAALQLASRGLEVLRGRPMAPALARTVAGCFELLPEGGVAEHVAPLDCRGRDAVRLVMGVPRSQLAEYVERIGWPGPRAQVEELARTWLSPLSFAEVNVDAGPVGLGPTIGFSLPLPDEPRKSWASDVLQRMVEQKLCTPAKRDAVLDWSGSDRVILEGYRWPSKLCRTIGLKLVCRPNEPLCVKAYPYFECRFSLWM